MGNHQPFITIGIASYNYAQYLPRAFDAIKNQTFKDYEILYCDDGSTDNSVEVIQSFMTDNPNLNIRLVCGDNGGIICNKNRILENACGDYVMICDADDWMEPSCLEMLANAARESQADRVVSEVRNVADDGGLYHVQNIGKTPSKWNQTIHHGAIYRRNIIEQFQLHFDLFPDDFCFIEQFNCYGNTHFLNEQLYNWWIHTESTGHILDKNALISHMANILRVTEQCYEIIDEKDDVLHLQAEVLKWWLFDLVDFSRKCKSGRELISIYKEFVSMISNHRMEYLNNRYIYNIWKSPFRESLQKKILLLTLLERIHLLLPALFIWHAISQGRNIGY